MPERVLWGAPASPGIAIGTAWRLVDAVAGGMPARRSADPGRERDDALAALQAAARELSAVAAGLAAEEAEIVEAGVLMAQDPALAARIEAVILRAGLGAVDAILLATGEQADAIAAIGDQTLAARADDVRSLGRRAARLARDPGGAAGVGRGPAADAPSGSELILVAEELGPADVAELAPALAGVALAGGGPTAHAAIVARSLGVPMVTGIERAALELADGTELVLDGTGGSVSVNPSLERARLARRVASARRLATERAAADRDRPAITRDGQRVVVLANVASPAELKVGLHAGAEGIGLLRTELAFLDAADWPSEQQHTDALKPILAELGARPAVVRVLDFGADKSPPFLRGVRERGLELLLGHVDAFVAQLRAILLCAASHDVRVLLPMVDTPRQLEAARELLEQAASPLGIERLPALGSMIETPRAAAAAMALAERSDFLSIGTNDLTASTLGADRFAANSAHAHDPRVLGEISRSVAAAHAAGISIEVCGEAASDPVMLPLLVGLGVDEVSVGAARVGAVRGWVRQLSRAEASRIAAAALELETAEQVELAVRPLATELDSAEFGNGGAERLQRGSRVGALGA